VKLGMFAELSKWPNPKNDNAKIYGGEISRFRPACRLDAVVCERAHGSLRVRTCVIRCCRNLDLAGYLVQILDDVKAGKRDPPDDQKRRDDPSKHVGDHRCKSKSCQDPRLATSIADDQLQETLLLRSARERWLANRVNFWLSHAKYSMHLFPVHTLRADLASRMLYRSLGCSGA
jgi:hypothetical protein